MEYGCKPSKANKRKNKKAYRTRSFSCRFHTHVIDFIENELSSHKQKTPKLAFEGFYQQIEAGRLSI